MDSLGDPAQGTDVLCRRRLRRNARAGAAPGAEDRRTGRAVRAAARGCPTRPSATCTTPACSASPSPRRVGGAELDVGIFVDVCAEIARVCPSTAWNIGNLASHHWMLGYFPPETQDELWDVSTDVLIATSLAFPPAAAARSTAATRSPDAGRSPPASTTPTGTCWASCVRESEDGPPVDHRFALLHRSQYEIIDNWHAVGLCRHRVEGRRHQGDCSCPSVASISAWTFNGKPHAGSAVNPRRCSACRCSRSVPMC